MAEIFLEVKNGITETANGFADYLCRIIMNHLESKVVGISGNETWQDGSPAQIVFKLNISRDDADKLVDTLNDEGDSFGTWFLADE